MLHLDAIPVAVRLLLEQLATREELRAFQLGGGTSLALRFGHRLSVDLDFFATDTFEPEQLQTALNMAGANVVGRSTGTLTLDAGGVKLDFLRHAYPLLAKPDHIDGVAMLSIRDVTAMKLNAIANRGSKKDFFDLCELLKHRSLDEMMTDFESKYRNSDRFIVLRSMAWFEDAELEPDPISLNGDSWAEVQRKITEALRRL
jgi:predicted nucleotidyltransferase component of viral defense system